MLRQQEKLAGVASEPGGWSQCARAAVLDSVARSFRSRPPRKSAAAAVGDSGGDEEFRSIGDLLLRLGALALTPPREIAVPAGTVAEAGARDAAVLIVCATGCGPAVVLQNIAGALAAGCDVAFTSFGPSGRLASRVIEMLEDRVPAGHLRRLSAADGWSLPWPEPKIVVVTPTAAFLNDRPWVRLTPDPAPGGDGASLVEFYRRLSRFPVGLSALPRGGRGATMSAMSTSRRPDFDIQLDVQEELEWTPEVDPASIGVAVHDGVVTLYGEVHTYVERTAAKTAARQVKGVTALVDELLVESVASLEHSDTQIAEAIVHALELRPDIPKDAITVEVTGGYATLGGQVGWHYQRDAAGREAETVAGVLEVVNNVTLSPRASASDAAERISKALMRNAQIDADAIVVHVNGNEVTLTGRVRSLAEKNQAMAAVWSSPHVSTVHNNIIVGP